MEQRSIYKKRKQEMQDGPFASKGLAWSGVPSKRQMPIAEDEEGRQGREVHYYTSM